MKRMHPRRARFGVEALEGRLLMTIFLKFDSVDGDVTTKGYEKLSPPAADVQPATAVVPSWGLDRVDYRPRPD